LSDAELTVVAAIVGGTLAIAGSLFTLLMGESHKRRDLRIRSWNDLVGELEQNLQHQTSSTFICLEDFAFKHFRRSGLLAKLDGELQRGLTELYSRIHEKNELLAAWRTNLPTGKQLTVTD